MNRLTWLADVLRAAGLEVVEHDGWQTRGKHLDRVECVVAHHTASGPRTSNAANVRILTEGRPDLPGPLSQLGLRRDGVYDVIAAGRCNHNGFGKHGNQSIGIEAYNDGIGEPWPAVQVDAYQRACAAICRHLSLPVARVLGHKETDPNRKIDPAGIDMDGFRAGVASLLSNPTTPPTEELTMDAEAEKRFTAIEKKVDRLLKDAKSKTAWQGEIVDKLDALLAEKG